ncbi:phage late control D family protein [Kosakonia sp. H02]|nr:phage late control D family protein [Kosakonia sp. H02]
MLDALTNNLAGVKTPAYTLTLISKDNDDKDITATITPRLMALTITDNRGFETDTLSLTLDDADGEIQMPMRGNKIGVAIGWQGAELAEMGTFTVDQVTHQGTPDQVSILARSVDFLGPMNSAKDGSWHDTTFGAIVEDIAKRNSLKASVAPELAAIKIAHIDQSSETDAAFLTRLAVRNGAEIAVKSDTLFFLVPGKCVRANQKVSTVTISRSEGDTHSFSIADREVYGSVIARWQDTSTPKEQTKQIKLTRKTGATGDATDYTAGSKKNVFTLPTLYASKDEATRAAKAQWNEIQRKAATFSITLAQGRTDISAETPVLVSGFKKIIDETPWVIQKVIHGIDSNGFITQLHLELKISEAEYELQG